MHDKSSNICRSNPPLLLRASRLDKAKYQPAMTTFIHLPEKSTAKADWEVFLNKFLNLTFGKSFTNEISSSIQRLNKLRVDIQHSHISDGESLIPIYLNYITQINSLELRLPMSAVITGGDLEFSWTDAFDSNADATVQHSLSFEKASTLFNLASVYSYLAATASSSLDWKSAILNFTNAAGILDFISINFLHAPTNDLKVETTKGLAKLMLAQAQECFLWNYMQSTTGNIKHSLVSRLAEGTSLTYLSAMELISTCKSKLDCDEEIHLKGLYFHTFALFHYAQSYMETMKVGYAIAANQMAKDSYTESKRLIRSYRGKIEPGIVKMNETIEQEIQDKLNEWEKDNDLIYHQAKPEKNNVPTIKSMDGAKSIPFESQLKKSNFNDLFEKIVPMEAHKGMSIYSEKQAQLTREWNEKIEVANEEIKSFFEFSRLPTSVVEVQNLLRTSNSAIEEEEREKEDNYPRVLAMAHELESSPDVNFEQVMSNVQRKRAGILKQLEEAKSFLLKDERNTVIKGLPPNPELSKLQDEVTMTRNTLSDAEVSDTKLNDLWSKYKTEIQVLQKGTLGVQKWLSELENKGVNDLSKQVSLLDLDDTDIKNDEYELNTAKRLIDNIYSMKRSLELLMDERNLTLNDLKTSMHSEDISSILIQYSGASESELNKIFDEQLAKYDSFTSRLDALTSAQEDRIIALKDSLGRLLDLKIVQKKVEEKKKERGTIKAKLASLLSSYDTWKLCSKGANEAYGFYSRLSDRTTESVGRIYDIVNQREAMNSEPRSSISSTLSGGFGGHTVNNYYQQQQQQQQYQSQPPPPSYSKIPYPNHLGMNNRTDSVSSAASNAPPLPSKPSATGSDNSQPYSTPSVYNPNMYAQFGQNWKS